jgi:hypothetical protein
MSGQFQGRKRSPLYAVRQGKKGGVARMYSARRGGKWQRKSRPLLLDLVSSLHSDSLLFFLAEKTTAIIVTAVESRYFLRINGHPPANSGTATIRQFGDSLFSVPTNLKLFCRNPQYDQVLLLAVRIHPFFANEYRLDHPFCSQRKS